MIKLIDDDGKLMAMLQGEKNEPVGEIVWANDVGEFVFMQREGHGTKAKELMAVGNMLRMINGEAPF